MLVLKKSLLKISFAVSYHHSVKMYVSFSSLVLLSSLVPLESLPSVYSPRFLIINNKKIVFAGFAPRLGEVEAVFN